MYIATRFFNEYRPGDEVAEPKEGWIIAGLVQEVESKEEFMQMVDEKDAELLEALDPDKPVKRGKNK